MKYVTLADHAMREYAPDKIFAASQKAKAAIAELGGDAVINSTLGECQDDAGKLMVLPTVEKMLRSMPVEEMCSYAPIGGIPGFNEAVQISLFGHVSERFYVESVPTPGGCGALEECLAQPGAKVLMKSGRQLPGVLAALERRGLLERSALVSNCGLPGEQVYADLSVFPREQDAGSFATIIVKED